MTSDWSAISVIGQARSAPPSSKTSALLAQVLGAHGARALIFSRAPDIIRLQLACLDDREPRDRAATLVKSIRDNWSPPAKYLQRVGREEAAQQEDERQAAVAQAAQQRRTEVSAREQQLAQGEAEAAQLDACWEALDEAERAQIETAARQRLGVLARSGACFGALQAMRRTLLREMQEGGQLADAWGSAGAGGPGCLEI